MRLAKLHLGLADPTASLRHRHTLDNDCNTDLKPSGGTFQNRLLR